MKRKVYMIGNAHIDPVWLWRWQEGFAEIKATFKSALDRMDEFDNFVFTCAGACYYKWIEENAPKMFEEIKKRVEQGRWVIVNGWWLQPDCNIPAGESFVRHALYSQRYYMEKFGKTATCGYNVDSFGHNAMLPQLLKKSGMDNYVFMRPGDHEKDLPNLFLWESKDGSRVKTFKIPMSYTTPGNLNEKSNNSVDKKIESTFEKAKKQGTNMMCFFGVGNHGGGPTIKEISTINDLIENKYEDSLLISSPDKYFNELEDVKLPIVKEDLQHHASGCYSANSKIKMLNRKAELRIQAAEKADFMANTLLDAKSKKKEIKKAWENIMFNQFHDILCGCSIEEAYDDAYEFYGQSLTQSAKILNFCIQRLSWQVDTSKNGLCSVDKRNDGKLWIHEDLGVPLVIFNTHCRDVKVPVKLQQELNRVEDNNGSKVPCQKIRASRTNGENDKYGTLFNAKIPAMGYKLYWGYKNEQENKPKLDGFVKAYDNILENDYYKITFDKINGYIKSMYDKKNKSDVFKKEGCIPIVIDESHCDTWAHGVFEFRKEVGRFKNAKITVMENGPIRAMIRVKSKYNNSILRQDFYIYAGRKYVSVKTRLNFKEKHRMLKMSFPVQGEDFKAVSQIPYGFITKKTNGTEEPFQKWVMIKNSENYSLALINNGKYSYDAKGNDLRMTCLRTPIFADHYAKRDDWCEYSDIGESKFEYMIVADKDMKYENITRMACEFNSPPIAVAETFHKGKLPGEMKIIDIDSDSVNVTVLKECEENTDYVIRMVEISGKETTATVNIPVLNRTLKVDFKPCEIKTYIIPKDISKKAYETDLLERKL